MKNIERIAEAFKDEKDIVIICSDKLALKLNQELANIDVLDSQEGVFRTKIDLGFNSVFREGLTIHYRSDFEGFINDIKNEL